MDTALSLDSAVRRLCADRATPQQAAGNETVLPSFPGRALEREMPNHIHGIFEIVDGGNGVGCRDDACIVSTMVTTNPMERMDGTMVATNPMGQMDGTDESSTNPQQSGTHKMATISLKSGSVSRKQQRGQKQQRGHVFILHFCQE